MGILENYFIMSIVFLIFVIFNLDDRNKFKIKKKAHI